MFRRVLITLAAVATSVTLVGVGAAPAVQADVTVGGVTLHGLPGCC